MKLRENIEVFKHFKKYGEEDGVFVMKIIKKASKSQFFYNNLDILLNKVKSFDRMALKDVAELPMNNLIVSKAESDKRAKSRILPKLLERYGLGVRKEMTQQQTIIMNKKIAMEKQKEEEMIEKALMIHTKNHTYQKDLRVIYKFKNISKLKKKIDYFIYNEIFFILDGRGFS